VIIGDFNARVSDSDCNSLLALNLYLSEKRNSNDKFITSRGKRVAKFCNRNQLTIFNGRTNSDSCGEYTFVDTIGSSVIDYAMVNQSADSCIRDMKVCLVSHSPHCALQINLEFKNKDDKIENVHRNKIIFRKEKKDKFQTTFQSNFNFLGENNSY